jgi:hypothetical protein
MSKDKKPFPYSEAEVRTLAEPYIAKWIALAYRTDHEEFDAMRACKATAAVYSLLPELTKLPTVFMKVVTPKEETDSLKKHYPMVEWLTDDPHRGHKAGHVGPFTASADGSVLNIVAGTYSQGMFTAQRAMIEAKVPVDVVEPVFPTRYAPAALCQGDVLMNACMWDPEGTEYEGVPYKKRYDIHVEAHHAMGGIVCLEELAFTFAPAIGHRALSANDWSPVWDRYMAEKFHLVETEQGLFVEAAKVNK